jgi:hypothetical protein
MKHMPFRLAVTLMVTGAVLFSAAIVFVCDVALIMGQTL